MKHETIVVLYCGTTGLYYCTPRMKAINFENPLKQSFFVSPEITRQHEDTNKKI